MEHYAKSVLPIIEASYDKFTQVERTIGDFFLKNQEQRDFSAKNIAGELFVSEASLSRFAKKCGFRGYREFIYRYETGFVEKEESITGNTRMVLNAYQELLNKSYSLIDEAQIARVGDCLGEAKRVLVCGKGSSGLAAREMELRFMRIGVDIDSVTDSDFIRMQAVFQDEKSLVIGISISGRTPEILYVLKEAHRRGAKTVLITANRREELAADCSEVVLVPSLKHLDHGNVISPQFPILVLTDIIYSYYVAQEKEKRAVLHDSTLKALREGKDDY